MKYLLDVNVLVALADPAHIHHKIVMKWFNTPRLDWGVCAFTEAGFLRVTTNPNTCGHSVKHALEVLADLANHPGYHYWPITTPFATLTKPIADRIHGHQQVTDALLLGLAIKEKAILVTLDKAMKYLAGEKFGKHVLLIE